MPGLGSARSWHHQDGFDVRFDWGAPGVAAVVAEAPGPPGVVVVVDVLRFTTAVEAANASRVTVVAWWWGEPGAAERASALGARLVDRSDPDGASLSPLQLQRLPAGSTVVLPSPNGSTCAVAAAESGATVLAACLRSARAVAETGSRLAAESGGPLTVIACGERWPDGSLRPATEDLLGAGAVLTRSALPGPRSPEAELAAASFGAATGDVAGLLQRCVSGREAIERGWEGDLDYATQLDVSTVVPMLTDGAFRAAA